MKNNLKIIYFITLFLLINPIICFAKVIEIDNETYDVLNILETDTYVYDAKQNILTLTNANLKTIKSDNNLKIVLVGSNKISNDNSYSNTIEAKEIEITGEGKLLIDSKKSGIKGTKILINNTNLNIKAKETAFTTVNTDMIVNNSNLILETELDVFNNPTGDLYFNNSNIDVNYGRNLLGGFNEYLYINNTNLSLLEVEGIRVNQLYVFVNGISNVFVYATRNYFPSNNYIISNDLSISRSDDNINYYEVINKTKDKYIKIESNLDFNLINQKQEKLNILKNELIKKEDELNIKENSLIELEKKLLNIEEDNKLKQDYILLKNEELEIREIKLLEEKELLDKEKNRLKQELNSLEKRNLDLNKYEDELNLKLEKIINKEEELKKECKVYKEGVSDDNIQDNFEVNEEFSNSIENPKTINEFYKYLFLMIISLIGILFLIIKRKEVLDG